MVCSNCGYELGPDDQFCGGCGAYLTDPPAEPEAPTPEQSWVIPYAPARQEPPPRRTPSAAIIAAAIAALVLVAVLLIWLVGHDGDDVASDGATTPAATQTTDGATTEPPGTSTETSSPAQTETATGSPTQTAAPEPTQIELAGSAAQCSNVGSVAVYRGNSQTSCPFAENVARAYAELEQPVTEAVTLSGVASPVTGQTYDLTCDFTTPVRCAGGDNAVVYLSPSS